MMPDSESGTSEPCETWNIRIDPVPIRIMILEDKSTSMSDSEKWDSAVHAINVILDEFIFDVEFGLDMFPTYDAPETDEEGNPMRCAIGEHVLKDVGPGTASDISQTIGTASLSSGTPLYLAMANFANPDYAPIFSDVTANSENYLVIVSDGADTCGTDPTTNGGGMMFNGATGRQLADATIDLREDFNIKTIVVGFGEGADPNQLNAIAGEGGTRFDTYLDADDGDQLTETLTEIVSSVAVPCSFELGEYDPRTVNMNDVNFYINQIVVPYDEGCAADQGWTWGNEEKTIVEFCEAACAQMTPDTVQEISAKIGCPRIGII
jgi:hypothetical protein